MASNDDNSSNGGSDGESREMRVSDWLSAAASRKAEEKKQPAVSNAAPAPQEEILLSTHAPAGPTAPAAPAAEPLRISQQAIAPAEQAPAPVQPVSPPAAVQRGVSAPVKPQVLLDGYLPRPSARSIAAQTETRLAPAAETEPSAPPSQTLPFDFFRFLGAIVQFKRRIVVWSLAGLSLGLVVGLLRGDTYSASALLILRDVPTGISVDGSQTYRPKTLDKGTMLAILGSDALLQRVAPKIHPPTTAKQLDKAITYSQERSGDYVRLTYKGGETAQEAVDSVNAWADEAVRFTKEYQAEETHGSRVYLQKQNIQDSINSIQKELTSLRAQYSDQNPLVREKLSQIEWYQQRLHDIDTGKPSPPEPGMTVHRATDDSPGYFNIISPATIEAAESKSRWFKGAVAGAFGGFLAFTLSFGYALSREVFNRRLRTPTDLAIAVGARDVQKVARFDSEADAISTVAPYWTRVAGGPARELNCFWSPSPHDQCGRVLEAMLQSASRQKFPILWVDAAESSIRVPGDFRELAMNELSGPLGSGRFRLKLDTSALAMVEADQFSQAFRDLAMRHGIQVWMNLTGPVLEPNTSLARHANRVHVLAAMQAADRAFWKGQAELLRESVTGSIEWVAVNETPWYRW